MDKSAEDSAALSNQNMDVLYEGDREAIYAADLTPAEAKELNEADEGILVEPNISFTSMLGSTEALASVGGGAEDAQDGEALADAVQEEPASIDDSISNTVEPSGDGTDDKPDKEPVQEQGVAPLTETEAGEEPLQDEEEEPLQDGEEEDFASLVEEELRRMELQDQMAAEEQNRRAGDTWNIDMVHGNQDGLNGNQEPVKVAVLDSGVDFMVDAPVDRSVNLVSEEQDITFYMNDMTGHGSSVADIIYRMNPNASIYSVRVLDSNNEAPLSRIIQGIRWCMENGVDVINMSFGAYQDSQALEQVIEEATAQGIVIVAAAGNSNRKGVAYPAAYKDVLAVGAVDAQAEKTEDSAVGEEVDIVAPGDSIEVQIMLGFYTCADGTSMAAAHAAGAASVLLEQDSSKDGEFVNGLLKASANSLGEDNAYGNGLLDLDYALESYDTYEQNYEEAAKDAEGDEPITVELEENKAEVPTYTEEEVNAGALWNDKGHEAAADEAINFADNNGINISKPAIRTFKKGAIAPDVYAMSSHFHGAITSNYIASYRFITKIASLGGDTILYP